MWEKMARLRALICCFVVSWFSLSLAEYVEVSVEGVTSIASTDDNFICATLDWWPTNKCDYNQCPWGKAGIFNLVCMFCFAFSAYSFIFFIKQIDEELNFLGNLGLFLQDLDNKILNNAIKGKFLNKKYYSFTVTSQGEGD